MLTRTTRLVCDVQGKGLRCERDLKPENFEGKARGRRKSGNYKWSMRLDGFGVSLSMVVPHFMGRAWTLYSVVVLLLVL